MKCSPGDWLHVGVKRQVLIRDNVGRRANELWAPISGNEHQLAPTSQRASVQVICKTFLNGTQREFKRRGGERDWPLRSANAWRGNSGAHEGHFPPKTSVLEVMREFRNKNSLQTHRSRNEIKLSTSTRRERENIRSRSMESDQTQMFSVLTNVWTDIPPPPPTPDIHRSAKWTRKSGNKPPICTLFKKNVFVIYFLDLILSKCISLNS